MNRTIAWRAFSKYLHDKGYSDFSENGNPSTTYNYPSRIDTICKRENFSNWDELGEHFPEILDKYSKSGCEEDYGKQSHGSNLKALQLFVEFYGCFDAEVS